MKRLWARFNVGLVSLIIGAGLTRLIGISFPHGVVWDEVYFKADTADYLYHTFYFDLHPPLAKLLMSGWMWLTHISPASATGTETDLRIFVAIFGIAVVPLVYGVLRRLTKSKLTAVLGGLAVMLNGILIIISRLVLTDIFLTCFALAAVYTVLRWHENYKSIGWLVAATILAGAAASVKWTGITALVLVLVIFARTSMKHIPNWIVRISGILGIILLSFLIYLGSFWIHLSLLNKAGPEDAYTSAKFQSTLIGGEHYSPSVKDSFWDKFIELNKDMYEYNESTPSTDASASKWYTWPLETKPVYIWEGPLQASGTRGNIYEISNPIIWWLSSLSVIGALVVVVIPKLRKHYKKSVPVLGFLLIAYFINWLPFERITRPMFLYHYIFASIYSTMILVVLVGMLPTKTNWKRSPRLIASLILALIIISGFLYFAPLNYGWQISQSQLLDRNWISSWF
jgi:dolichyl-phosphate-mannose-protein mannosyltransferase